MNSTGFNTLYSLITIMSQSALTKWGPLVVICLAVFIMVIDTTIMNVSISALVVDLQTDVGSIQMAITIYALIMASLMLIGGELQEIMGRKKTFMIGVVIYGFGTLTASISQSVGTLMLGWSFLEGVAAAMMLPATATFLTAEYEGKDRAVAFGIWGGIAATAVAFGPIVGGYLTTFYSWRWAFRLELMVVIIIILLSFLLKESKPRLTWKDLDIPGCILSCAGLGLVVIGILISKNPDTWMYIPFILLAGFITLAAFFSWENRRMREGKEPLTDVTLLKNKIFDIGNAISVVQALVFAGFMFIIPIYLQSVLNLDAFNTGLILLPMSFAVFIVSIIGVKAAGIISARSVLLLGLIISILGGFILRDLFTLTGSAADLIPGMIVFGVGMGLILSQVNNLTLSAIDAEHQTDASGILNALKQLGTSLGTAIIGVVLLVGILNGLMTGVGETGISSSTDQKVIVSDLNTWIGEMKTTPLADVSAEDQSKAVILADSAVKSAMKSSFDAIIIILSITTIITLFLPKTKRREITS